MASVTSLGLHEPTGLQHAIQEGLLSSNPVSSAYTWSNACHDGNGLPSEDDELLVTPRCVIWSRGEVFRKSYNFDLEEEPVTQALLTTFPSVDPLGSHINGTDCGKGRAETTSTAIVVFLKTQAHIYFLSGATHVIHLPFEVESAIAAPDGLIIQRKLRVDSLASTSLKFPEVPPSSFVSNCSQPWSASNSQQSTFSIADLNGPRSLPLPIISTLRDPWDPPTLKDDSNWPRLFSLSDPLSEMGLIVTESSKAESRKRGRHIGCFSALGASEELLYVSRKDEITVLSGRDALLIAVTLNQVTSTYTVWRISYICHGAGKRDKQHVSSGTMSRRRSSYMPGTGSTTPVMNGQSTFRESFAGNPGGLHVRKLNQEPDTSKENVLDLATTLDPDFEGNSIPRRKSRRVSSMLARADLSTSHEHTLFSELASAHPSGNGKRSDSLGVQSSRKSNGPLTGYNGQSSQFNRSIGSFLEAPVDDLLDELRAGGDFEGFHNMGLEDEEFDALKQEIIFKKICSVQAEYNHVRFSSQHISALNQRKVVVLGSPCTAMEDPQRSSIVVCILDSNERRLLTLTLHAKQHIESHTKHAKKEKHLISLSQSSAMTATGVMDICKLDDGGISRLLVLNESADGTGRQSINLQAPWSYTMPLLLPGRFLRNNIRNLSHDTTLRARREGGHRRVFSEMPVSIEGFCNSKPRGLVALLDESGHMHQVQVAMQPRSPHVCRILETCRAILPGSNGGEGILVGWWCVHQWLRSESIKGQLDLEWSALSITIFSLALGLDRSLNQNVSQSSAPQNRKSRGFLRSSSGAQVAFESWAEMKRLETANRNAAPVWADNNAWQWTQEVPDTLPTSFDDEETSSTCKHVKLARAFLKSQSGRSMTTTLPPWTQGAKSGMAALVYILVGLHLLREEDKLDTSLVDSSSSGSANLLPVLQQVARWLNWTSWVDVYSVEQVNLLEDVIEDRTLQVSCLPETIDYPSIYDWIQHCLLRKGLMPFKTISDLLSYRSDPASSTIMETLRRLTPRTLSLRSFFASMRPSWSAAQVVEALFAAGITPLVLETLPEAVLAPFQESIAHCQAEPPTTWPMELLAMVGREDVNSLLSPRQKPRRAQASVMAPSHQASLDIHTICSAITDAETTSSIDGSAEVDRQAITRSIFKDDRRIKEAASILSTFKPTMAHCKIEPNWTDSGLLEAQKEHAQMLAYRTLAIPSGRGLLYYSARIPLLTQKFAIGGFNLSCIMKPDNNTVGVDKNAFTEEKVCWAFFHSGVAAGLSISRDARGIDTSWILYNKPAQDLSNRHAGFLLALGLNGHLKSVAKWVAFKYLTPKHTMTSIGLLLGLAASYLGTMDSLITRLLSVHVTRMLPPGAAELNLSPLTQTTGIMGIGILYCNTQHRRMSEIMLTEIEHIDQETEEEPLRNEGYRLAAGFALGFINLGKGSDLKGLHDMQLTERLLTLASGSKKVNLVHILDKATAASVVAIALIYMKSENQVVARKVDVPDSVLQFDYVRPDIFLLRTLARHLITWSDVRPTFAWMKQSLPEPYRQRSTLENIKHLTTEDMPFYDIVTGLCFAVALRYAGSASLAVRDLLIHYLDQLMRICRIPTNNFDQKLTRNTVRNCQDLVALAVATVMAGTGDLVVFRRLRSMHGRDDNETPYGSHLAAHLAVGALFLGGGTFTFGTSNLAIAALLVAFYPIFPSSVQDNKSHLQAFRHFWVLAAESRCLVARDIDTNQPVSLPITISLRNDQQVVRHTPCLLPELAQIKTVRTDSSEYWNIVLDFKNNPAHVTSFKSTPIIRVRRRPAYDASTHAFKATLQALNDIDTAPSQPLEWLFELPALSTFTKAERALVLPPDHGGASAVHAGAQETVIDSRLMLEHATLASGKRDRLLGLRLLFEWAENEWSEGREMQWIRKEVIQRLMTGVWMKEGAG